MQISFRALRGEKKKKKINTTAAKGVKMENSPPKTLQP